MHKNKVLDFAPALKVAVLYAGASKEFSAHNFDIVRNQFLDNDVFYNFEIENVGNLKDFDMAVVVGVCGSTPFSAVVASSKIPCISIRECLGFHTYSSAFYRDVERRNGIVLPANTLDEIKNSIAAVRALKALRSIKLLTVDSFSSEFKSEEAKKFINDCKTRLGINIELRLTDELMESAEQYSDDSAKEILQKWYGNVLEGPGEMDEAHMIQVAKLYLAELRMLEETGAKGITVQDVHGFLTIPDPKIMPNVSYGPLVFDGYLVTEEADITVLVSELLLYAGLGTHPTMSNIYMAYRDQYSKCSDAGQYTPEMELMDLNQCINDNHLTVAHFSASGVLPPNMMEEDRYRVREALPSWKGQSMIVSTPKLGPMVMARISQDVNIMHVVKGEADSLGFGDQYGWFKGRWFIKVPDMIDFMGKCQHPHYAIAQDTGNMQVLKILTDRLLGLKTI